MKAEEREPPEREAQRHREPGEEDAFARAADAVDHRIPHRSAGLIGFAGSLNHIQAIGDAEADTERDFADAELRGAWPSLGYATSAWAQRIAGRTLLSEAYLTVGALALSVAGVFLLALHLSQRWTVALLAAACVLAAHPKLYNYEKVLVLFVGALLIVAAATALYWAHRDPARVLPVVFAVLVVSCPSDSRRRNHTPLPAVAAV